MHLPSTISPPLLPFLLLPLLACSTPARAAKSPPADSILLSDVQSLTLRAGRETAHRRVSPIPQLKCVSPRGICKLHEIDVMRCTNQGSGYSSEDVQWSCSAALPPELRLGSTDVICEGHAGPQDPRVLRGSCGVEYRLALTEKGEEKWPELVGGGGGGGGKAGWGWGSGSGSWFGDGGGGGGGGGVGDGEGTDWSAWIFGVVFVAVVLWILVSACSAANDPNNNNNARRAPRRPRGDGWGGGFWPGGGGGGGGGGPWNDPPPPYPGTKPSYSSSEQPGGWRPGFWSGALGGAAAAYAAGAMGRNNDNNNGRFRNRNGNYGGGGSSWGSSSRGGGGGGGGGGGSSSTSSERYESTGFGSTSRR